MKLRYTPRARSDLAEIYDFIAQDNLKQLDGWFKSSVKWQKRCL